MSILGGSLAAGPVTSRMSMPGGTLASSTVTLPGYMPQTLTASQSVLGGSMALPTAVSCAATSAFQAAMPPRAQSTPVAVPGAESQASLPANAGDPATMQVPCLTAGLPTPDAIAQQKEAYARGLEEQLKQGVELLGQTHKQKTDFLHRTANQNKHQYNLLLDQKVKQQEMELQQQFNQQLMILQQAAAQQRTELEQQAASLCLEWEQRNTQQEFLKQQAGIQQRYAQVQKEIQGEMSKLDIAGGSHLLPVTTTTAAPVYVAGGSTMVPVGGSMAMPVGTTGLESCRVSVVGSSVGGLPVGPTAIRTPTPMTKCEAAAVASSFPAIGTVMGRMQYSPPPPVQQSGAYGAAVMEPVASSSWKPMATARASRPSSPSRPPSYAPSPNRVVVAGSGLAYPVASASGSTLVPSAEGSMAMPIGTSSALLVSATPRALSGGSLPGVPHVAAALPMGDAALYAEAAAQAAAAQGR